MFSIKALAVVLTSGILVVSGCSNGGDDADSGPTTDAPQSESFAFGEPADPSEATRVILIEANDDFSFTPDSVEVTAGEIVTFSVSNAGNLDHEFTLGGESLQQEHEREMEEMGDMQMGPDANAIAVSAGETGELTWKFASSSDVLMGCHVAGHYDGGMRGEITVADV